ncbi:MAG: hypothetical protein WBP93_22605 [Pyrinomonadaceae bacterium]
MTLLGIGVVLSLVDFITIYIAAVRDGVLYINQGVGLFNHYGLFSTIIGNAIALYAAKKYYDGVCSIRDSKAVVDSAVIKKPLKDLQDMVELRGKYRRIIYSFLVLGTLFWASNAGIHLLGDPVARWGHVLDAADHPWSFVAGRLHNIYTWIIIMPFVVHVMICSSIQLWRAMAIALKEGVLRYDLLNPDQRGGFGFVDNALLAFNVIAALVFIEITLHSETFGRLNLEHITDYIILIVLLFGINKLFFAHMYATVKRLRMKSLNKVKDDVFNNNELSFEILKYCYERRVSTLSIANFLVQASAIAIPGIVKYWPVIVRAFSRA